MRTIQATELNILKAVDELCKKHGLRYTIYCGTLLGAVRHGGFIPWDDDIDIAMPLKDYFRFQELARELPEQFICSHFRNTPDGYYGWTKVIAKNTTYMPLNLASLNVPWGLFVDVYPFIGAASTEKGVKYQQLMLSIARRLRSAAYYHAKGDKGLIKSILYLIPFCVRQVLSNILLKIAMKDPDQCEKIGTIDAVPFEGKFYREDWQEMTQMRFEGREFNAPLNYDIILRRMYGDYMRLPPQECRHGHIEATGKTIIDPNRGYDEYRREILGS